MSVLTTNPTPAADRRTRHAVIALLLTAAAASVGLALGPVPLTAQLLILSVGVALTGMPHGALDGRLARIWLEPKVGRTWAVWFTAIYLLLSAAVLAAWLVAPVASLAGFLLISAWHFGSGDATAAQSPARLWAVESFVRGAFVLSLPAVFHQPQVAELFGWLIPATAGGGAGVAAALAASAWVVFPLAAGFLLWHAAHGRLATALELLLLPAVFAALPPLLGFAVYFCVWHAPRHLLGWLDESDMAVLAKAALPATLVTLGAMAAAAWWLSSGAGLPAATVRVLFVGLSALTVPHMLLDHLAAGPATPSAPSSGSAAASSARCNAPVSGPSPGGAAQPRRAFY